VDLAALPLNELLKVCSESGRVDEWEEFIRRTNNLLHGTIRRTCNRYGLPVAELIDDFLQDIYLKIAANREKVLQRFIDQSPEGIYAYLKIMAVNLVTDSCRSNEAARRRASQTVFLEDAEVSAAPAGDGSSRIEREVLLGQVDSILQRSVLGSSSKRDRSIFWLYYQQGMTSKAIASLPGVELSAKGVEALLHRLTRLVRTEIGSQVSGELRAEGKAASSPLYKEAKGEAFE
jgi:RNA polymerase sigma-70 factor (ECF subfamily)